MRSIFDRMPLSRRSILPAMVCLMVANGCDTVQPDQLGTLVLESILEVGQPLPTMRVTSTWSVDTKNVPGDGGVAGALVELELDGETIPYLSDPESIGLYRPPANDDHILQPRSIFRFSVRTADREAFASGIIPPMISLRDVSVIVPDEAIEAVLLDTLDIGIDSLDLSLDARQGFIYPIQVDLEWDAPDTEPATDGSFWIETRLEPKTGFTSSIIDFFLLPKQVLPEAAVEPSDEGGLRWSGVYAVPVDQATTPVPEHVLRVLLLRGDQHFAKFETSRDNPERREPETNVRGGIGFVGGIAMDSLSITIH